MGGQAMQEVRIDAHLLKATLIKQSQESNDHICDRTSGEYL